MSIYFTLVLLSIISVVLSLCQDIRTVSVSIVVLMFIMLLVFTAMIPFLLNSSLKYDIENRRFEKSLA